MTDPQPAIPFLHIDAGNIITWGVIAIAWIVNRSMDYRGLRDRVDWNEEWIKQNEEERRVLARTVTEMGTAVTRLTTLVDVAEKRLERIERRDR